MKGPDASPVLERVSKGQLCSGCGACAAVAPDAVKMQLSDDGFLRPAQEKKLDSFQEKTIESVCPGVGLHLDQSTGVDDPLWGPYIGVYSGYATDPDLRRHASSGGGLSALAVYLLESGSVDRVLQIGADPVTPIANHNIVSLTADAVFENAGSRYAPSAPLADLEEHLATDLKYAFIGKPCDVAALRALARVDKRVNERIIYMLSFFCAGVPSLHGAKEVVSKLGVANSDVAQFRYRGDGWPGFAKVTLKDGRQAKMSYAESWGGILSRHVQFRCKICPDGTGSFADVVCADAWESDDKGYPIFMEREGISLVMSRTKAGEALVRDAVQASRLHIDSFDISQLAQIQPGQTQKRRFVLSRLAALYVMRRPRPAFSGFHLWSNAKQAAPAKSLKNFIGTLRRIVMGKL